MISHDSETSIGVGNCNLPGCYNRPIRYTGVSVKQMVALAAVSSECQQEIRV